MRLFIRYDDFVQSNSFKRQAAEFKKEFAFSRNTRLEYGEKPANRELQVQTSV